MSPLLTSLPASSNRPTLVPTYEKLARFDRDFARLTRAQQEQFLKMIEQFIADLRASHGFRAGLRVKRVQGAGDVWELTWAPDGRATWEYGPEQLAGEPHIIWRRIGTHTYVARCRSHWPITTDSVSRTISLASADVSR